MKKTGLIIIAIVAVIGIFLWSSYNSLVSRNESADNQWAKVETQYQRRFDLIPNLVEAVKGAMSQEQKVFGDLAEARSRYSGAQTANEKAGAASEVESAFSRLLVVMENYPQLKSIDTVQTLMAQLEGSENRISVERSRYNDEIKSYNLVIKRFPGNLVASMFGYSVRNYFQAEAGSENAPKVDLQVK
ncbi:MAG: LemA family protein [Planctomycetes bacterium]|jgi:LemA protein|nr:LemA family protein [Planctomycetota bacterium]